VRVTSRQRTVAGFAALLAATVVAAPAAGEDPERPTLKLERGGEPITWNGTLAPGLNQNYDAASGAPCGDALDNQCDTTLLKVDVPKRFWETRGGGVEIALTDYTIPASDFDLYVYKSDREGKRGKLVGSSGGVPGMEELAEISSARGFYLIQVVYYAVLPASSYTGAASFAITGKRAANPPDIDRPRGLQDVLASNPRKGFRSHSEMQIAQDPNRPRVLVAASKFYNKDRDSLREYEFKVGSYVSFNRGRTWRDLGQTRVCKPSKAPPASWPNNTCYPRENPRREGTGEEDGGSGKFNVLPSKLRGEVSEIGRPFSKFGNLNQLAPERRGGDFAEEYITSDPWVQFDDEGNAYLMVLDSPPFASGNGWGMSFHRWDSVRRKDVKRGRTWGKKRIINAYPSEPQQSEFLDDKNTFAVNNAGEDKDGEIGTMVACWGQNIASLIKQQTVCERSTDGGRSWPGEPLPISPPSQQLVIGVSVVADTLNPERFYALWFNYTPTLAGAPGEYWFARSDDGGQTWPVLIEAAQVNPVPTQFPGSDFRNLSIPIMAAGPNAGELYATYAEYRPASAADSDGMQADIMLIKSTDGGVSWSDPQVVNNGRRDADQFQPMPAVTPRGQLNIAYFDRRKDPDNFYIDTYLSRSNDAGATFEDVRVSHDMWDPSQRPPISGSGEFIGDYQGLVADRCFAYPFVNDTHLANDADRDPRFDKRLPRSQFQEAISWRVPNKPAFGGEASDCG